MSKLLKLILTASFALAVLSPATAFATGAGDQQYCDPLAGCNSNGSSGHSGGGGGGSSHSGSGSGSSNSGSGATATGASGSSTPSAVAATSTASTTSSTGSGSATANGGRSLPYTGIDAGLVALVGVGMLGAGFVVRRRITHERG